MNFKQLEAFIKVADLKSFTLAARQLYMSQPAVSFQIKALEEELQVSLFQRNDRKTTLSEAGQMLYPQAKDILHYYRKMIENLENLKGLRVGKLLIGASTIPGEYVLPLFMGGFRQMYPGIEVALRVGGSGKVVEWVRDKEVALGITGTFIEEEGLECESWISDRLVLIAPGEPYWQNIGEITLQEFTGLPLILRESGSGTRKTIENCLYENGVKIEDCNVIMEFGSTRSVITAVQAGLGVSLVSRWAAREPMALGKVTGVGMSGVDFYRMLYLLRNPGALGGVFAASAFKKHIKNPCVIKSLIDDF